MTNKFTLLRDSCLAAPIGNRTLDGLIFKELFSSKGDVWSDLIGEDDVWHRRDPEDRCAWDGPAAYTTDTGVALSLTYAFDRTGMVMQQTDTGWHVSRHVDVLRETPFEAKHAELPLAICAMMMDIHAAVLGDGPDRTE